MHESLLSIVFASFASSASFASCDVNSVNQYFYQDN